MYFYTCVLYLHRYTQMWQQYTVAPWSTSLHAALKSRYQTCKCVPHRWSGELAQGWDVTAVSDKSPLYGNCGYGAHSLDDGDIRVTICTAHT